MNPQTALIAPDNPILWQVAEPVAPDEIAQAIETARNMYTVMLAKDGAGLAAPQVGISKRFFIVKAGKNYDVFINPEIIDKSPHETTEREGCLSMPGYRVPVRRPRWVTVRYSNGEEIIEKKFRNMSARVIQHEHGHLLGQNIFPRPT